MSAKQDRVYTRTASQLKQEINFGESFAKVMGIATDARTAAEEAKQTASSPSDNLTPEEVFNLLTNNGQSQGLYRDENGELYINASYLKSGILDAATVQVINLDASNLKSGTIDAKTVMIVNLVAEKLSSVLDNKKLEIDGSQLRLYTGDKLNVWLYNIQDGWPIFMLATNHSNGSVSRGQYSSSSIKLGYDDTSSLGGVELDGSGGQASLRINREGERKALSWKDNGDGTYTLIGT